MKRCDSFRRRRFLGTGLCGIALQFFSVLEAAEHPELPHLPNWIKSFSARVGVGYRDNVSLANTMEKESGFFASGADVFLMRLPVEGNQFHFFFSADDLRYFQSGAVDKEQTVIGNAQFSHQFNHGWRTGAGLQYLYQDQIIDVSSTEVDLSTIRLKAHTLTSRLSLRKDFTNKVWLEFEPGITRGIFAAPLDDYWEAGPKVTLGREYGNKSKVSLGYEFLERDYDDRTERTSTGISIPDAPLRFYRHMAEFSVTQHWDQKRHWRTVTKLGFTRNEDHGSGFFDYYRYHVGQQLRYQAKTWELKTQLRYDHYDYLVQRVSLENPASREENVLSVNLRAEKSLTKWLKLYANYNHERSFSNQQFYQYAVNTVSSGAQVEF